MIPDPRASAPRIAVGSRPMSRRPDARASHGSPLDLLPDVRDGLTRLERVVLWQIDVIQKERRDRNVPTAMLYGRVLEHVDISEDELQRTLQRLGTLRG